MPSFQKQPVIFTDLDGTLLAHEDYRFDAVMDFLPLLGDIPVIPATSKTRPEVERVRRSLHLDGPFMAENGSAVYLPRFDQPPEVTIAGQTFYPEVSGDYTVYRTGADIRELMAFIEPFKDRLVNFVTCPIDQAIKLTGLPADEAVLARQREHTVPVVIEDDSTRTAFIDQAATRGFTCVQGGRFLHLQGACSKGLALRLLCSIMEMQRKIKHHAIALGDSENDRLMLEAADIAVVVNNPASALLSLDHINVIYTSLPAPEGWVEGVRKALESIGIHAGEKHG